MRVEGGLWQVGKELDKKDVQTVLGRTGKDARKGMKDFGGGGGSDEDDVSLLDEIKHLHMRISFTVTPPQSLAHPPGSPRTFTRANSYPLGRWVAR